MGAVVRACSPWPGEAARARRSTCAAEDSLSAADPPESHPRGWRAAVAVVPSQPTVGSAAGALHGRRDGTGWPPESGRPPGRRRPGSSRRPGRQGGVSHGGFPFALVSPSGLRRRSRVPPDELRQVAVPTLVIWGERDPLGGASVARGSSGPDPAGAIGRAPSRARTMARTGSANRGGDSGLRPVNDV